VSDEGAIPAGGAPRTLSPAAWAAVAAAVPPSLERAELEAIAAARPGMTADEVASYLPLARLVVERWRAGPRPLIVAVTGSVAVGKSTTAELLAVLLGRVPEGPRVAHVSTDGFLLTNAELVAQGALMQKGFPATYDRPRLLEFVTALRAGQGPLRFPLYSHVRYDVVPDEYEVVDRPDVVVLEGLHVLLPDEREPIGRGLPDLFALSVYVDASRQDIERWFVERLRRVGREVSADEDSPLQFLASLDDEGVAAVAHEVWTAVNLVNLVEHIEPTRDRADLVFELGPDHAVRKVRLRPT